MAFADGREVVTVRNLKVFLYTDNRCNKAVDGVSLGIKAGRTLCLVGESGCGKSITALSIMRLLPELSRIEEGAITLHGEQGDTRIDLLPPKGKTMRSIRGSQLSMIFQDPMTALNPVYTIGFQIMESLRYHMPLTRQEHRERTLALLKDMGMPIPEQRIDECPHQLSGGMRQRALIAMAMACNPKVLIADEPTTALDVTIQAQVFELMRELQRRHNTAILFITHDMGVVAEMAHEVVVMYMGSQVESGTVEEVLRTPRHPYTINLLHSIPALGRGRNQTVNPIRGSTPDPYDRPRGCQFAPRCDHATPPCHVSMPPEEVVDATHRICCWNYRKVSLNAN